jgi:hypothetical protein
VYIVKEIFLFTKTWKEIFFVVLFVENLLIIRIKKIWRNKKMELEAKSGSLLDDGKHEGVIIRIDQRENPFKYFDLVIEYLPGCYIKCGFPQTLTPNNKTGLSLAKFGVLVIPTEKYDLNKIFIGKKISFMTLTKISKNGKSYSNIIHESIKINGVN